MIDLHECGDPHGHPVLYLHGSGSSRLEADVYDSDARTLGVRMVSWDRPGSGQRPPTPARSILDVVPDVRDVLSQLKLTRAPVVGLSGGGVHALALACAAPELVTRVVLVNPGGPATVSLVRQLPARLQLTVLAARWPWLLRQLSRPVEALAKDLPKALSSKAGRSLHPVDLEVLRDPAVLTPFAAASLEGACQPGAWANEALMFWHRSWPFDPTNMQAPVEVFSGSHDPFRPFALQLQQNGAQIHSFPGGHVSGFAPDTRRLVLDRAVS